MNAISSLSISQQIFPTHSGSLGDCPSTLLQQLRKAEPAGKMPLATLEVQVPVQGHCAVLLMKERVSEH